MPPVINPSDHLGAQCFSRVLIGTTPKRFIRWQAVTRNRVLGEIDTFLRGATASASCTASLSTTSRADVYQAGKEVSALDLHVRGLVVWCAV